MRARVCVAFLTCVRIPDVGVRARVRECECDARMESRGARAGVSDLEISVDRVNAAVVPVVPAIHAPDTLLLLAAAAPADGPAFGVLVQSLVLSSLPEHTGPGEAASLQETFRWG